MGNRAVGFTWRLLVVAVVVATIAVSLAQSLRVYFMQAEEIAQLRAEVQATNQEIAQLQDQISRWNDPEFVRAAARERLGWVMPGEVGYRVIGADGETLGGEGDLFGEEEDFGDLWWQQMWGSVTVADRPAPEDEASQDDTDAGAPAEPAPTPERTP